MFVNAINGNSLSEFSGALEDLFYLFLHSVKVYTRVLTLLSEAGGEMKAEVVPLITEQRT